MSSDVGMAPLHLRSRYFGMQPCHFSSVSVFNRLQMLQGIVWFSLEQRPKTPFPSGYQRTTYGRMMDGMMGEGIMYGGIMCEGMMYVGIMYINGSHRSSQTSFIGPPSPVPPGTLRRCSLHPRLGMAQLPSPGPSRSPWPHRGCRNLCSFSGLLYLFALFCWHVTTFTNDAVYSVTNWEDTFKSVTGED